MTTESRLVYFESTVFLALVNGEPGRVDLCRAALSDAEAGHTRAITSAFTITEVIRPKGGVVSPEVEAKIDAFFRHSWLHVAWVDRLVAEEARSLIRTFRLKPPDAIHVATAKVHRADLLFTYDNAILAIGNDIPGLTVCEPIGQLRFA